MDLHANAVLTVRQRQRVCDLVAAGLTITAAALVVGCSRQTASKWVGRRAEARPRDRSSRPHRSPMRTPGGRAGDPACSRELARRAARDRLGARDRGLDRACGAAPARPLPASEGLPPQEIVRYERSRPGELVHVDFKKLGRILTPGHRVTGDRSQRAKGKAGWQYLYVAIDDHSRLGFARVYPDETTDSATRLPQRARPLLRRPRHPRRARPHRQRHLLQAPLGRRLRRHGIAVRKTRAYRPQTNGKAERFIRTLLERWAYAYPYERESQRLAALAPALDFYNRFRPHRALGGLAPLQRVNNLPGTYI